MIKLDNIIGAIQVFRNTVEVGDIKFPENKRYESVRFNVISVTGMGGCQILRKNHYVTLEWPHLPCYQINNTYRPLSRKRHCHRE